MCLGGGRACEGDRGVQVLKLSRPEQQFSSDFSMLYTSRTLPGMFVCAMHMCIFVVYVVTVR